MKVKANFCVSVVLMVLRYVRRRSVVRKERYYHEPCKTIDRLKRCLDAGDAAGAERQASAIKGAAANVTAEAIRSLDPLPAYR